LTNQPQLKKKASPKNIYIDNEEKIVANDSDEDEIETS
jgi:hypothetical protein